MLEPTAQSNGPVETKPPGFDAPSVLTNLWRMLIRFDANRVNRWMGLRNALGVALPVAVFIDLGHPAYAVVAGMGALNVAAADGTDAYRSRATRMLASTCLGATAIFLGSVTGHDSALSFCLAALWAFATGMLVALGTAAADIGMLSLVSLFIYIARPTGIEQAAWSGVIALGAGLLQTGLSILPWPLGRFGPERRVIGDFYAALSRAALMPPDPYGAPLATQPSNLAQEALSAIARDHSVEAERYYLLVSQAERIRITLFSLTRVGERMKREEGGASQGEIVQRSLESAASILQAVAGQFQNRRLPDSTPALLEAIQNAAQSLGSATGSDPAVLASAMLDARSQIDALAGQLRAALELAQRATPAGESVSARREALVPWRLQLTNWLATLRANLSLDSSACRHAIRLALCIMFGLTIAGSFSLPRSYWLAMTIALVLKPDFGSTFSRGILRLGGTYVGLLLATTLFHFFSPAQPIDVLWIAVLVFVQRWVGRGNYGILVVAISALIVFMLSLTGIPPKDVIAARALNTTIGGALALVIYWVWPTRERTQAPPAIASMFDAYRLYFQGVSRAYFDGFSVVPHELDRLRMNARRSRSNAETSVDRLAAEPLVDPHLLRQVTAMLASSHRFIHAVMSMEAGLSLSHAAPARDAFRKFSNDLEKTLYFLAARLRGSPVTPGDLADLREDHNSLVHSGDTLNERYALVNVETDRMTNSLNTLAEQVFRWAGIRL
jgi:uncharacterized membrane protein YccC